MSDQSPNDNQCDSLPLDGSTTDPIGGSTVTPNMVGDGTPAQSPIGGTTISPNLVVGSSDIPNSSLHR